MASNLSPLAQTFKVSEEFPDGVFITSIDLFFHTVGSSSIEVQLVNTLNGYPTEDVLPDAKCIKEADTIIENKTGMSPTNFKFSNLIFLAPNTEYAIKVMTNSTTAKLWTSVMGGNRVDNPAILITQQPALGSLFKSQNNSTWTPEQLQDMAFVLRRAKFNTNVIGQVKLVEKPTLEHSVLPPNPFKVTTGQKKVKVHHPNHGLTNGMLVKYYDCLASQFNNTFSVTKVVNTDYYIITLDVNQAYTDFIGGDDVKSEKNIIFDTIRVDGIYEGKEIGTKVVGTFSGASSVDGFITDIVTNQFIDTSTNKFIHSSINRAAKLSGASSFTLGATISSLKDTITPVIDINSIHLELINNKINNPSVNDVDYDIDGEHIVIDQSVTFNAADNSITIPPSTDYSKIMLGAWFKATTAVANLNKTGYISKIDTDLNKLFIVGDTLVNESATNAFLTQYTSFVSELYNGGTAESKTITKVVTLEKMSAGFRVIVEMNIPNECEVDMYYRVGLRHDAISLTNTMWTKREISYKKTASETEFTEYEYNITNLDNFDEFQFKFVMRSTNTAVCPKMKNLRIIAHA